MTDLDRVLERLREEAAGLEDEPDCDIPDGPMVMLDDAERIVREAWPAWPQPATGEREDVAARLESWSHDERLGDGALLQKAAALLRAPEPAWVPDWKALKLAISRTCAEWGARQVMHVPQTPLSTVLCREIDKFALPAPPKEATDADR